jgi:hypothetical protein
MIVITETTVCLNDVVLNPKLTSSNFFFFLYSSPTDRINLVSEKESARENSPCSTTQNA